MSATIIISGKVGTTDGLSTIGQSQVLKFSVANNYMVKGTKRTDWYNVSFFGKAAEYRADKIQKGSKVMVIGRLETYDGKKGLAFTVNANQVEVFTIEEKEATEERPFAQNKAAAAFASSQEDAPF